MRSIRTVLVLLAALLAAGPLAVGAARAQGAKVALVVGNAAYPDADAPLPTPVEDARALGAELQRRGFAVDLGENLTRRALREALDRLLAKVEPGATVLVAFSGYGVQAGRQNYLIPVDAQIWSDTDVQRDGFGVERLLSEIERKGAGSALLVVDAAYRNPFERRFRSYSIGLAAVNAPPGAAVLISAAPGAVLKQPSGRASAFGAELVRQIAADGVGVATLERTREALAGRGEQAPALYAARREPAREASADPAVEAAREPVKGPARDPVGEPAKAAAKEAPGAPARESWTEASAGIAAPPPREPVRPPPEAPRPAVAAVETRPAPNRPEPPPADLGPEFRLAQSAGTRKALEDFLARHAAGPYADLARAEIDRIDEGARKAEAARRAPRAPIKVLDYSAADARLRDELGARIARNPDDGAALYRRGQIYAVHEDFPRALADFNEAIRLNPRDVEALNNRCWVRGIAEDYDGALADCNEALRLRPGFLDALDSRGFINLKIGLPRRALADYDAALKVNAKHASALYGRGLARLRNGEAAEGNNDLTVALVLDPKVGDDFARYGVR